MQSTRQKVPAGGNTRDGSGGGSGGAGGVDKKNVYKIPEKHFSAKHTYVFIVQFMMQIWPCGKGSAAVRMWGGGVGDVCVIIEFTPPTTTTTTNVAVAAAAAHQSREWLI